MKKKCANVHRGFTLVEVLIVISIITLLVLLGTSYYRSQVFKGHDAVRKAGLKELQIAFEEYEKDNNCYPDTQLTTCDPGTGLKPYTNKIPCDPQTKESYFYETDGTVCSRWYRLYTVLVSESDTDTINPGVGPSGAYNYYVSSPNAPNF
jgi:prepilin-type N-terminal cleavage/methylation domain-containing protein